MSWQSIQGWEAAHTYKSRKKNTKKQQQKQIQKELTQTTIPWGSNTNQRKTTHTQLSTSNSSTYGIRHGNTINTKSTNTIRITSQNINGIPAEKGAPKSYQCFSSLQDHRSYDVALWQEIKLYWPKLPLDSKWKHRTKNPTFRTQLAYNTHDEQSSYYQQGGTATTISKSLTGRTKQAGSDSLGRWSWIAIESNTKKTYVVSVYCPCVSTEIGSTYQQHRRHIPLQAEPREVFFSDLSELVTKWHHNGDSVIIGGDFNHDIRTRRFKNFLASNSLHDPIAAVHGEMPYSTHQRNESNTPIDTIVCSIDMTPISSGYCTHQEGVQSDHVMVWADFARRDILPEQPYAESPTDRLNVNDPRTIQKYNRKALDLIESKGLDKALNRISSLEPDQINDQWMAQYDKIVAEITRIRMSVKSRIRHKFTGSIAWSPQWKQAMNERLVWKQVIKYRLRPPESRMKRSYVKRLMKLTGNLDALQLPMEIVFAKLSSANHTLKTVTAKAEDLRKQHLNNLDRARALQKGIPITTERNQRLRTEEQRRKGRVIKYVKSTFKQPVLRVLETIDGSTIEHSSKESVEQACINEGMSRFSQTWNTPPMQREILQIFGEAANTKAVEETLAGTFDTSRIENPWLRRILEFARMPEQVKKTGILPSAISLEEHIEAWQKQRPETASTSTALSFTDHIAASYDPQMAEIDRQIREIPFKAGQSTHHGESIEDFQILKKAGVWDVEKMRIIQLMSASFNMNNKKIGRDAMNNAEKYDMIPDEQAGARKHRMAITSVLEKVLVMDIIRMRKLTAVVMSNDAKACYDRIVLWLAAIAICRLGIPAEPMQSMILTLQKARHSIKTAYGLSTRTYSRFGNMPLQGVGQGNGAGPTIWAAISAILITIMHQEDWGFSIISCFTMLSIALIGFAFVDDTDLVHVASHPSVDAQDTLRTSQKMFVTWENLLDATGGALRPEKCFWYLIDFKFSKDRWKYKADRENPGTLHTRNGTEIARYHPSMAKETLGVYTAMDGNWRKQKEMLTLKAKQFALQIGKKTIQNEDAWYVFQFAFLPTLDYSMPVTSLTRKDWDEILKPVLSLTLQKAGIASTFPRDLVFTPTGLHGLGIIHPYYKQNLIQIQTIFNETHRRTMAGKLIQAAFEELQRTAGWTGELHSIPTEILKDLLPNSWGKQLLLFCKENGIKLSHPPFFSPRRDHDQGMTEVFYALGYRGTDLVRLKNCCDFIEADRLSDLVTLDGKSLKPIPSVPSHFSLSRIPSKSPSKKVPANCLHWEKFKQALDLLTTRNRTLRCPLGSWRKPDYDTWKWWYSPSAGRLFSRQGNIWEEYEPLPIRHTRHGRRFQRSESSWLKRWSTRKPGDLQIADVKTHPHIVLLQSQQVQETTEEPSQSLYDTCENWPTHSKWAISQIRSTDDGRTTATNISSGSAIFVSDGSYMSNEGSAAVVASDRSTYQPHLVFGNKVFGPPKSLDSYRAELSGIYASLTMIQVLCRVYKIKSGSACLALDGESAIKKSQSPLHDTRCASFDLIHSIQYKIQQLKKQSIQISFEWVEGHQLEKNGYESPLGKLNRLADEAAKAMLQSNIPIIQPNRLDGEQWSIILDGVKQDCFNLYTTYNLTFGNRTSRQYWTDRYKWTDATFQSIDWEILARSQKLWPWNQRKWISKMISGFAPTGRTMFKRDEWDHSKCPRCEQENEDSVHVITCQAKSAQQERKKAINYFLDRISRYHTHPEISDALSSLLSGSTDGYGNWDPAINKCYRDQSKIGILPTVTGTLIKGWATAQDEWIQRISTRWKGNGALWASKVANDLKEFAHTMWEHRNEELHHPEHPWKLKEKADLYAEIHQKLFHLRSTELHPSDSHLDKPIEDIMLWDLDIIRNWIHSAKRALDRKKIGNRTDGQTTLTRWLDKPE